MPTYYTLLTTIGRAKIENAIALGQTVEWTQMAVGDGNGNPTVPMDTQAALVNERYRAGVNSLTVDAENPQYLVAEMIIPANIGGWMVHEVGIFDSDGDIVAIGNFPVTYKPVLDEGSGRDMVIRILIGVSNTAAVTLKIDPTIVLASRQYVDQSVAAHEAKVNPHPQYATKTGVQAQAHTAAAAIGTADDLTAVFSPAVTALAMGMLLTVRTFVANTAPTPTFTPNSGIIAAKTIVKGNGLPLVAGDIAGGGHWLALQYDSLLDKWVLLNPASPVTASGIQKITSNGSFTVPAGIDKIWASGCAGGGGGGGAGGKNTATLGDGGGGGGGGGAGQSVLRQLITVQPGEIIPITIGGGGSKGLGAKTGIDSGTNGTAGGATVIGSYITLSGGGAGASSHVFTGGAGGQGGSGYPPGSDGGDGISASSAYGGAGASGPFGGGGGGGRSGSNNGAAGYNAAGYGAGGGGGGAPYQTSGGYGGDGGNGSPGLVIIEW